jgi:hypothetical protein
MGMQAGTRVSWQYQGTTTYGTIVRRHGKRERIQGREPGTSITRVGTKADPVVELKSESTGRPVLKRLSELKRAPKRKQ